MILTKTSSVQWQVKPTAEEIPPQAGSANSLDVKGLAGIAQGYLVSLNSYFFLIYRENEGLSSRHRKTVLERILGQLPGASQLTDTNRAVVFSSSIDYMQYHQNNPVLQHQTELAKQHVEQLKQRKIKNATRT